MMTTREVLSMFGTRINNRKWQLMYRYIEQTRLHREIYELNVKISQNDFYPDYDGYVADMEIELKNLIIELMRNKALIQTLEGRQKADKLKVKELNRQYQKEQIK